MIEKLYNADFRAVLPQILAEYADRRIVVVSDPPFNIGYHYNEYRDKLGSDEYQSLMCSAFGGGYASVIIHYPEELYRIAQTIGRVPDKVACWAYNSNTSRQHRDVAFFGVKPNFAQVRQPYKNPTDKRIKARIADGKTGARLYDWWVINQVKNVSREKTKHPCQMPLEVMRNIIGILPPDSLVIDPFMGSGTTGVACKLLGRDFIGVELDKEYFEISRERIAAAGADNEPDNKPRRGGRAAKKSSAHKIVQCSIFDKNHGGGE